MASRDLIPRRSLFPARRLAPVVAFLWLLAQPSLLAGTSWQEENPLAVPRNQFAAAVVGGKLHVYGGNVDWDVYEQAETEVLEIFDPATGTWSQGALGPKRGEELEGTCIDGVFYLQFGLLPWVADDIDRRSGRCFRYTPGTDFADPVPNYTDVLSDVSKPRTATLDVNGDGSYDEIDLVLICLKWYAYDDFAEEDEDFAPALISDAPTTAQAVVNAVNEMDGALDMDQDGDTDEADLVLVYLKWYAYDDFAEEDEEFALTLIMDDRDGALYVVQAVNELTPPIE